MWAVCLSTRLASGVCGTLIAGVFVFRMPAFSAAIFEIVLPNWCM